MRRTPFGLICGIMALFALTPLERSSGAAPPAALGARLTFRPLRDLGGLDPGLNVRLTKAFTRFLSEHNDGKVGVEAADGADPAERGRAASLALYSLEGDLAYAEAANEESGRYLCTLRLYREGQTRTLIGQWAATARSLRALTANLRHDPRTSEFGLVGELGSRAIQAILADERPQARQFRALAAPLKPARDLTFDALLPDAPRRSLKPLTTETALRLALRARKEGDVILVRVDRNEMPHRLMLPPPEMPWHLEGSGETLSAPFRLPADTVELCLLFHAPLRAAAVQGGSQAFRCADDPIVEVLNGIGMEATPPEADPEMTHLMQEILRDPSAWSLTRIRVTQPRK